MDVEIWIPSEIRLISPLVSRLIQMIKLAGCVPGKEDEVELALRESVCNAVIHGNRLDPQKRVYVCCHCEPGNGVSLVVRDEGRGFDPREIPDATSGEGIKADHGRGILLMKFYMDEVSFQKNGTEVRMWKASRRKSRTAPVHTNQTIHAESASRYGRAAVIAGMDQERGETC